ncbi:ADP-ribosylation factor-binding protein GGA3-like, partial [Heterodontus francisci]|uniref:ADP-ribosylation factor-binding protein GGA3-like n=1 Tax=Heterodontus francisci TaxID=7792 RepID=UPI00355AF67D
LSDPPLSTDIDKDSSDTQWNSFQVESAALNPFTVPPAPDGAASSMTPLLQPAPRTLNQPTAQSLLTFPGISQAPHIPAVPLLSNIATISSVPQPNLAPVLQMSHLVPKFPAAPLHSSSSTQPALSSGMFELDMLGQKFLEDVKGASGVTGVVSGAPAGSGYCTPSAAPGSPLFRSLSPQPSSPLRSGFPDMSLSNVTVPLETIKPNKTKQNVQHIVVLLIGGLITNNCKRLTR